jgi:hypothetical protein
LFKVRLRNVKCAASKFTVNWFVGGKRWCK